MQSHEAYIRRCFSLALEGAGHVSPNPMVGAVLVYQDRVIGEGYHAQYGQAHAEVNCIESVTEKDKHLIEQSVLYVSLEPCSHYGKTPPCTDLIIRHHIKKVVVGCKDISAKVNGKGIETLRVQGIEVVEHILEQQAIELNKRFFTFHQRQRPYIILKWAQSKEGFIGSLNERILLSDTITNQLVHQWRAEEDALWVGFNTARIDNPQLNVRYAEGKNPVRIVYDRRLELDEQSHLFDQSQPTLLFNTFLDVDGINRQLIKVDDGSAIPDILAALNDRQILSVLVEGGQGLLQQLIDLNLWDEARMIQTATSLSKGVPAPVLKNHHEAAQHDSGTDRIFLYKNTTLL